jgi:hypothetical protein
VIFCRGAGGVARKNAWRNVRRGFDLR